MVIISGVIMSVIVLYSVFLGIQWGIQISNNQKIQQPFFDVKKILNFNNDAKLNKNENAEQILEEYLNGPKDGEK